jgi:hypothetical protein
LRHQAASGAEHAGAAAGNREPDVGRWPDSGPMRADQQPEVSRALGGLPIPPKTKALIIKQLIDPATRSGAEAADLIARGHLVADGYANILGQFAVAAMTPGAMMSLRFAEDLHGRGYPDVVFALQVSIQL